VATGFAEMGGAPARRPAAWLALLNRPEVTISGLRSLVDGWPDADRRDEETVEVEIKYDGYVQRELGAIERLRSLEKVVLPRRLDYAEVAGLTAEVRDVLQNATPSTLGQATRVPGMRPAAVSALLVHLRKTGAL
jgi:tRNA uridine 5-carboxymethylaminomethyl modification enzyme